MVHLPARPPVLRVRAKPRQIEDSYQMALMAWAHTVTIRFGGDVGDQLLSDRLIHCPNGGSRNRFEAYKLKRMGVQAGVPDLQLPLPVTGFCGGWWELKAGKNDTTDNQDQWHAFLRSIGHHVAIYWDWKPCAEDILKYLNRGPWPVIARGGVNT
jgi:hypothetical protein